MTETIEEQAKNLAQKLIAIGETRLPPDEKQKHAEATIIHALRTAKADGMFEAGDKIIPMNDAYTSVFNMVEEIRAAALAVSNPDEWTDRYERKPSDGIVRSHFRFNNLFMQMPNGDVWRVWVNWGDHAPTMECIAYNEPLPPAPAASIEGHPERDWPEDFGHENGNYTCRCGVCRELFTGYKRRVVCKKCVKSAPAETVEEK